MDKAKLKVLQELEFRIRPSCAFCVFSTFPNNDWGTCATNKYEHEKHTGEPRDMSIHKSGLCYTYMADHIKLNTLEGFAELYLESDVP